MSQASCVTLPLTDLTRLWGYLMAARWEYSFKSDNERSEARRTAHDRVSERDSERTGHNAGGRPCGRGQWCSMATRERQPDGTTVREPAKGTRAFCDRDDIIIGSCLRGFPNGYALLDRMLVYRETAEVLVRVPFGPNVAIRVDLDELARLMIDAAMTWLERVAEVDPTLTAPDTSQWRERSLGPRAGTLLGYAAPRLAERVSALTALAPGPMLRPGLVASIGCGSPLGPAGDTVLVEASGLDAGSEALKLGYLWRSALGLTPAPRDDLLGVDCESCGKRSLRRSLPPMHDGDRTYFAECGDCGALFTDQEFRSHSERLVRFYSRRVTPAVLAAAGLRGNETRAVADAAGLTRAAA